jgi:hypothetical protein
LKKKPKKLKILKTELFSLDSFIIELSIIGASHYLNINNQLFEVFAATKIEENFLKQFSFNKIENIAYSFDNFNYSFKLTDSFKIENPDLEFNYIFPGEGMPETKILLKKINNSIYISTYHSYPNENIIIFTETVIEIL